MSETLNEAKAAVAAFFGGITAFLGWHIIMLLTLVALMILDYFSGTAAARQNGTWKSEKARNGIGHKLGMGLIVLVCVIADYVMIQVCNGLPDNVIPVEWPVVIFPMVTIWYILTEIGSIIENAMAMGAPVPAWLPKLINAPMHVVDTAGEMAAAGKGETKEPAWPVEEDDYNGSSGLLE